MDNKTFLNGFPNQKYIRNNISQNKQNIQKYIQKIERFSQVHVAFKKLLLYNRGNRKQTGGGQMTKKRNKRFTIKGIVLIVVSVYIVCNLVFVAHGILDLKTQQRQLSEELEEAQVKQAKLQEELEYMNSEEAMEKIAREKLGLIKNDEILIRRAGS